MKHELAGVSALAGVLLALAAPAAQAQAWTAARVLSATPVYASVPVQQCAPVYTPPTGGGAAVGALLGGLIGSQFGSGNGHIAGAILGTIGGAALGNAAEASQSAYADCRTAYQPQLTGYDVRYELDGRTYTTRTAQAPGAWLQVPVAGVPVQIDPQMPWADAGVPGAVVTAPRDGPAIGADAPPVAGPAPYTTPVGVPLVRSYGSPVYAVPTYAAAPVYVAPPVVVAPIGLGLSIGGGWGRHGRVGWGVSVGNAW